MTPKKQNYLQTKELPEIVEKVFNTLDVSDPELEGKLAKIDRIEVECTFVPSWKITFYPKR